MPPAMWLRAAALLEPRPARDAKVQGMRHPSPFVHALRSGSAANWTCLSHRLGTPIAKAGDDTAICTERSPMSELLEQLIAVPYMIEVDSIEVEASADQTWKTVRHTDLARAPLVRTLFELRQLPERLRGKAADGPALSLEALSSTPEHPGFSVLLENAGRELVVGAIGKVWQAEIPYLHVEDAAAFDRFEEPGWVKVAWSLRVEARGDHGARITIEVWVSATDDNSWQRFKRYFALVAPGSHFIRRAILTRWQKELGRPSEHAEELALPGDELLADAQAQVTQSIDVQAPPERLWPWLLQMGAARAGFYSYDLLDNAGRPSAREVHPEWQHLSEGEIVGVSADNPEGFEVLRIDAPHTLLLGGLYDTAHERQMAFSAPRPKEYWHVTWAFVLQRLDATNTRLVVRARACYSEGQRWHALAIRPTHHFMQAEMLRQLARRAEGNLSRDTWRDLIDGVGGALWIAFGMATPFLRPRRRHWGLDRSTAERVHPGDDVVAEPQWSWTHGVTIEAPASRVWPWVAQVGADRAGFYSYQWLENLAGCELRNAEAVHPEWELKLGDPLILHPRAPALRVVHLDRGHYFVASAEGPEAAQQRETQVRGGEDRQPWVRFSWLFWVEPLTDSRCRVISRARYACSDDLVTRLSNGPLLLEPVGFAMDRKMLLGIKALSERSRAA